MNQENSLQSIHLANEIVAILQALTAWPVQFIIHCMLYVTPRTPSRAVRGVFVSMASFEAGECGVLVYGKWSEFLQTITPQYRGISFYFGYFILYMGVRRLRDR